MLSARVYHDVAGTVHRTQDILFPFALHHRVHVVAEVVPVAGLHKEFPFSHRWRHDVLVTAFNLKILDPPLQLTTDGGAGRQPEDMARAHVIDQVEELEIATDAAMVAATGLL